MPLEAAWSVGLAINMKQPLVWLSWPGLDLRQSSRSRSLVLLASDSKEVAPKWPFLTLPALGFVFLDWSGILASRRKKLEEGAKSPWQYCSFGSSCCVFFVLFLLFITFSLRVQKISIEHVSTHTAKNMNASSLLQVARLRVHSKVLAGARRGATYGVRGQIQQRWQRKFFVPLIFFHSTFHI